MSDKGIDTRNRVLKFIAEFQQENNYSPSNREVGKGSSLSSSSSASKYLKILKDQGYIDFIPNSPRTLTITEKGNELLEKLNS
ncbi:hypothetical protein NRIC_03720 [Enterococcus florum]|uniref:LexA repressor DNA-binding domain-containing protein n=1 Tax=Enterococcus florum TaxID=2480627 RepID=A0A4P5P8D4_9ENTE|nr:hypothetical protein NRIC_03720 [Enterococcus florum]